MILTNFETESIECNEIINVSNLDLDSYSKENLALKINMDSIAYIIYTSGSAGMPKGAMIGHGGLTNYICWAGKTYFKSEHEAMALYSSIAFDLTVTSVFAPLVSGSKIVIYDNDETEFVLHRILRENKATVIKLTPAHLTLLRGMSFSNSKVKVLIVGGDDLKVSLAKEINDNFGDVEIYNEYGPTEATVGCMTHKYDEENDTGLSVPIGRPIDNAQIYVLNDGLDVVPAGLTGEIYISGDGVAHGYLNNDELTLETFLDNPFIHDQKMYKTGDLARYLENGLIEYAGRTDNQVKIRGHRVELGEIETCLIGIKSVKNAAVIVKESPSGGWTIIAYVVTDGTSEKELRNKLSENLPRYMIPAHFVFMDELPLTINGKIDTSLLPEPAVAVTEFTEGKTPEEKQLIQAVEEVLGINGVSLNDNFYQLGGDSIKAIQISSKLNNAGYAIKARDILTYEIIGEIATHIEVAGNETIEQGPGQGSFAPTPIIKWFFEQGFANENHYKQSILLETDNLNIDDVKKAVAMLIEHHDALRLNYNRQDGSLFYNNKSSSEAVDYYDLSAYSQHRQDREVTRLGDKLKSGFNIEKGILFKACVFDLGERGCLLLLTAHHIVIDGVSWRVILEDLDYILKQLSNNRAVKLPLKTHSFKKWAETLSEYAKSDFEFEKFYWSFIHSQDFHFPVNFDKGPDTIDKTLTLSAELNNEATERLLTSVGEIYGIEPHEALTIALAIAIRDVCAQEEVVIEIEGHGREEIGEVNISRTVGWFTSLYPVQLRVLNESLDLNIKYLKEQLRKVPNKGLDFGILKYLKNEFENSGPYVRFNYLGDFDSSLRGKSFRFSEIDYGQDVGKHNHLTTVFDINAMIINGKLRISITFSMNKFRKDTVSDFLIMYIDRVIDIVDLSVSGNEKKFTPSDFSASDITQEDLDRLFV